MSAKLAKLRATLALLDNSIQQNDGLFNDENNNNNNNYNSTMPMLDAKLIQRYESLRQKYITKTIEKAVLEELVTFDGTSFERNTKNKNSNNDDDTEQQQLQLLQKRHDHVLQNVIQAARHVHAQVVHVQTEQAVLQQRKAEILRVVEELEANGANSSSREDDENDANGNDDANVDMVDGNSDGNNNENDQKEEEVSEQDFAAEEACLAELQEKKVLLQAKLRLLQQETQEMEQDTKHMLEKSDMQFLPNLLLADDNKLRHDDDDDDDSEDKMIAVYNQARAKLQAKNEEMRQKMAENKEMISYFDGIRLVMQELGGIRLLSVDTKNDDSDINNNNNGLVLTVQFLKRHDVEIHLEARENETKRNSDNMRVTQARLTTPTLLQGPAAAAMPIVKLDIPPLDDLVQVAKSSMPDGAKGLHFLVAAILDRLETMQLRVEELSILQNSHLAVLTHVGPTYTANTATSAGNAATNINASNSSSLIAGGQHAVHQDIACRLVAYPLVAILRLSPDCPRRTGSVLLDQVVMVQDDDTAAAGTRSAAAAWFAQQFGDDAKKEQLLGDIVKNLCRRHGDLKSPVQVIRAIVERVEMALKKYQE